MEQRRTPFPVVDSAAKPPGLPPQASSRVKFWKHLPADPPAPRPSGGSGLLAGGFRPCCCLRAVPDTGLASLEGGLLAGVAVLGLAHALTGSVQAWSGVGRSASTHPAGPECLHTHQGSGQKTCMMLCLLVAVWQAGHVLEAPLRLRVPAGGPGGPAGRPRTPHRSLSKEGGDLALGPPWFVQL